ncbi:acetyltransferase [Devosia limi DSM 17137]|uniref:Acetyltransferase n=1 Tax=Devosia limi DSM 17137 TaxID=1121477 RepID=A0A0F5LNL9_9HYPH|nr:bifunctional acetate--CoA ligase family protein/GNAT family N-acetyltransferase [Devosia limi]KKB83704.1 acetyltransferase [Devosia limi DSM 17137]SHE73528.1 acetyltransferase [Devosia limi DSM 17137]
MTIRHLDRAFAPRSVALIGASERPGSLGALVLSNIVSGGFAGTVFPVNPKYAQLSGRPCYARVSDLPEVPDLCVIATPAGTVPDLVEQIGLAGGRAVVVITAGIGKQDGLRQRMLEAAGRHGIRIIGPNTIGLLAPRVGLNASFTHIPARAGSLALLSQSGAIVSSIVDWAESEGIGFSQIVSLGDMADVDVGDCLNALATDAGTSAILLYLESIPDARKFMSAARAVVRLKPVIALKAGRHAQAAKAAQTHTGALAGADGVVEAALRRAGIIRVNDLEDLFAAAEITARFKPLERGRVAIVTNGGGAGVLAVDHLVERGCELAELDPQTIAALDGVLPPNWSGANPVDIIGDAPPARYLEAIRLVAADPNVDVLLVMNCPTALASPTAAAKAMAGLIKNGLIAGKPVLATWLGEFAAGEARRLLNEAGIASIDTPAKAADAVSILTRWRRLTSRLQRVPSTHETIHVDRAAASAVLEKVAAGDRRMLTEPEAKSILAAYGIAVPRGVTVPSVDAVAAAATELLAGGAQLAVKMVSSSLTHKSDLGGVVLNLESAAAARGAAQAVQDRLTSSGHGSALEGFWVEQMVVRPQAEELLVGVTTDPVFGPVLMFGAGGVAVEVVRDTTMELLPVDDVLADDMIDRVRIGALLAGYRNRPAADRGAIVLVLKAVSQLLIDFPQIVALDINPLLADANGVIAVDARIEIDPSRQPIAPPNPAMAIRPYPADWAGLLVLDDQSFDVRAIRPVDAELYPRFLQGITREDLRLRFLMPTTSLSPDALMRLTQLDYDRDIAFVALTRPAGELAGVVRYAADPDGRHAEFGLLVRSDLKGRGLGTGLLKHLIAYARSRGIAELTGILMGENQRMQALCRSLGFTMTTHADDLSRIEARLVLSSDVSSRS